MKSYLITFFLFCTFTSAYSQWSYIFPCVYVSTKSVDENSSCQTPDGAIEINVYGKHSQYNYEWVHNGKVVSKAKNPVGLYGGDHMLTIRAKDDKSCSTKKHVLVHGIIYDDTTTEKCPSNPEPPTVTDVKYNKSEDGYYFTIGLSGGSESGSLDAIFRKITGMESGRMDFWTDVPKPGATISNHTKELIIGNIYEFVVVDDYGSFMGKSYQVGRISKPHYYRHTGRSAKLKSSINEKKLNVMPQPANDHLTISLMPGLRASSVEILSLNGQLQKQLNVMPTENINLNVSDLNSGLYLLKINSETESIIEKIIIK